METYKPAMPEVKDTTARVLLWVVLVLTVINMLMVGYVFYVVHHTVAVLQQIGDAFNQVTP
jgi:zona occludens toxin (predicted ATPase)